MNILYILGAYKPNASANGLCSDNIIQQLLQEGHCVTVLSNAAIGCKSYEVENNNLQIYHVKQRLFLRLKEWGETKQSASPKTGRAILKGAFILNKLQLFATAPTWPKTSLFTIKRFKKAALNLQQANHYDIVIAVYTPIEALLAGYAVKKQYPDVIYIPYFLDSLSGGYGPKYFKAQTIIRRGLAIEKTIFDKADKIVLMKASELHHQFYNKEYIKKFCFLDIPMLQKHESKKEVLKERNGKVKILFIGSIAASIRNPATIISALLSMNDENIICEFIGNIDCLNHFNRLKDKYGERLIFTDFVSHNKLAEKIESADVFLNIGNLVNTMVPSKIFEYMSYGKPIISTFDIKNDPTIKYLEKYPLSLLLDGKDPPEINAGKITNFISLTKGKKVAYEEIESCFSLNTPAAFTRLIIDNIQENDK